MAAATVATDLAVGCLERGAIQKQEELEQLIDLVQSRKAPRTVLEIGTAKGGTLWLWCQLAYPTAYIVSVDLPNGDFGGGYEVEMVPTLLNYSRAQQWMQLFRGNSHDPRVVGAVATYMKRHKRTVDFLFIDGDHSYSGVKDDWMTYSQMVKPGGLIVFHDIVKHDTIPECQVDRFWEELKQDFPHEEFISTTNTTGWGGIGVIYA